MLNEVPIALATAGMENSGELADLGDDALRLKNDMVPLNTWSRSPEPIGREISNFGHTPFYLDGKKYESIEGFYSGLLCNDPVRRAQIAEMWGLEAKIAGKSSNLQVARYGKYMIKLGSQQQQHDLLARAHYAKFEQNPQLARAFMETHARAIIHEVGAPDKAGTFFPREVQERMLTEIRDEYVAGKKIKDG